MKLVGEVTRFGVVGTVGFAVDGGLLWTLVTSGADPFLARAISFPVAVLATWWLNRIWTFAAADRTRPQRQLRLYFGVQLIGALSNFAVYSAILLMIEPTPLNALAALAVGSFFGMFINFTGSRLFIFRPAEGLSETCEKSPLNS